MTENTPKQPKPQKLVGVKGMNDIQIGRAHV